MKIAKKSSEINKKKLIRPIMGDFNMPGINYEAYTVGEDSKQMMFFETTQDISYSKCIWMHYRYRQGNEPSRLDYKITGEENIVEDLQYVFDTIGDQ